MCVLFHWHKLYSSRTRLLVSEKSSNETKKLTFNYRMTIVLTKKNVLSALSRVFSLLFLLEQASVEIVRQWIKKKRGRQAGLPRKRERESASKWMKDERVRAQEKEKKKNERLLSWLLKYDNTSISCTLSMISRRERGEERKKVN